MQLPKETRYEIGVPNGAVFRSMALDARALVHGEDCMVLADQGVLVFDRMDAMLESWFMRRLLCFFGHEESDDKEAVFLDSRIKFERDDSGFLVVDC